MDFLAGCESGFVTDALRKLGLSGWIDGAYPVQEGATFVGEVYPAGEYEALRITLGRGEGKNWWCVMFPPLCVIDCGEPASFYPDGRLEFKSILAELWRGIFG